MTPAGFSCPFCTSIFVRTLPRDGRLPLHPDPLTVDRCQGTGFPILYVVE